MPPAASESRRPIALKPLWAVHVAFVGLYALVVWDRWEVERTGAAFFTSVWVDLLVSAPAVVLFAGLPRWVPRHLGRGGLALTRWSLAEVPALVGVVGYLSGGHVVWATAHFAATLLLLALAVPERAHGPG